MIAEKSLVIKYLCLSAAETGLYVYYAHDTLNYYYKKQVRTTILDILFSELSFSATRVLSLVAICDTIINNSHESFYIFIGLKLTIFALIFTEIPLPHHFRYAFIFYLVPLIAQIAFVIVHYDTIIRGALWKYYRTVGSSPTLQSAYNVRSLLRVTRFLFYLYLAIRFGVFVVIFSRRRGYRQIYPYFYIAVPLDALCCVYEASEIRVYKFASLTLIAAMVTYLTITFAFYIKDFDQNGVSIIILDIIRGSIYFFYSLLDYFYYGKGLKEFYTGTS